MTEVKVFVEGPSDKDSMEALLAPLLDQKKLSGVLIEFFAESHPGDKKKNLLLKTPTKAANILLNRPHAIVVILPDLHPRDQGFSHSTFNELDLGIRQKFKDALRQKNTDDDPRLNERFKVFCFKYELEALLLAAEEQLGEHLGISIEQRTWIIPVEDQDHTRHPKLIIEELFEQQGDKYKQTVDAPLILGAADYRTIANRCPQCFKPFVDFIDTLSA